MLDDALASPSCLHRNARVAVLDVNSSTPGLPGSDRAAVAAARLIACAAARGYVTCLKLTGIGAGDLGAGTRALLASAVKAAVPLLSSLAIDVTAVDALPLLLPRLPLLTEVTWSGAVVPQLVHIIRHAPALRTVAIIVSVDNGPDLDATLAERCAECDAAAGTSVESAKCCRVDALRVLSSLVCGPTLRLVTLVGDSDHTLMARPDAEQRLFGLPRTLHELTLPHYGSDSLQLHLSMLSVLPGLTRLAFERWYLPNQPCPWQVSALTAALMSRRDITVAFTCPGPEVQAQLALPPAAREPWMARLAVRGSV